jgi:hypothetical protein
MRLVVVGVRHGRKVRLLRVRNKVGGQFLPCILQGRGTRRSLVEGPLLTAKNPSTALRAVPLPDKCRGGIRV